MSLLRCDRLLSSTAGISLSSSSLRPHEPVDVREAVAVDVAAPLHEQAA